MSPALATDPDFRDGRSSCETGPVSVPKRDVAVQVSGAELDVLREGLELLREQVEYTVRNEPPSERVSVDASKQLELISRLETLLDDAG